MQYRLYNAQEFPLKVYVVKMPLIDTNMQLITAIGQREEVSSIAKRSNAIVAINGSNYRRGGRYNGNRLNLLYHNNQILADLNLIRGSVGWNNTTKNFIIDTVSLVVDIKCNNQSLIVDQINQPRADGKAVLYTDTADPKLLMHTPGLNIIINKNLKIEDITEQTPLNIPSGYYIYQVNKGALANIKIGYAIALSFDLKSHSNKQNYTDSDFMLGGAGLLLQNGEIKTDKLFEEFSQSTEILHCNDEVAADFHTKEMQEWLINLRHPRTAIGTNNNELYIVVVDGRHKESEGISLPELALLMKNLGCINALNIGGGGCTSLCINNKLINTPSAGAERPVSEALCFF